MAVLSTKTHPKKDKNKVLPQYSPNVNFIAYSETPWNSMVCSTKEIMFWPRISIEMCGTKYVKTRQKSITQNRTFDAFSHDLKPLWVHLSTRCPSKSNYTHYTARSHSHKSTSKHRNSQNRNFAPWHWRNLAHSWKSKSWENSKTNFCKTNAPNLNFSTTSNSLLDSVILCTNFMLFG